MVEAYMIFNGITKSDNKPEQYPKDEISNEKDRMAKGWVSIESKDLDNEIIPVSELKKTLNIWMARGAPMTDEHSNRVVGKGLRWYEQKHSSGAPGIMLEYKIFSDYSTDDEVWEDIKSGKRAGLSFGGRATKAPTFKEGGSTGPTTELRGVESMEVASVEKPAHPLALNTAVNFLAKSAKIEINPDESATDLKGNDLIAMEIYGKKYNELNDGEKEAIKLRKKLAEAVIGLVKGMIKKPAELDRCVQALMDDPDFKPKDPNQTKEQAAYAVCQAQLQKDKQKEKRVTGPGGHVPDATGPHGRGMGPGRGRGDGTGLKEEPEEEKIIKKFLINRIDKKLDNLSKSLKNFKIKNIDKKLSNLINKLKGSQIKKIEKNLDFMINKIRKSKIDHIDKNLDLMLKTLEKAKI